MLFDTILNKEYQWSQENVKNNFQKSTAYIPMTLFYNIVIFTKNCKK